MKGAKALGIRTVLTQYLLNRETKQHNEIKKSADYDIEDFRDLLRL